MGREALETVLAEVAGAVAVSLTLVLSLAIEGSTAADLLPEQLSADRCLSAVDCWTAELLSPTGAEEDVDDEEEDTETDDWRTGEGAE